MPEHIPFFRVFVSSPGDVNDERKAVLEILDRLPNRPAFREKVGFRVVAWDKPGAGTPMLASMTPQEAIDQGLPKPSECDIVVVILWSRMGTPFNMDGVDYLSGTHYELMDAINSSRPTTLIYRRTEKKLFESSDKAGQEQYDRVQDFFKGELFYDPVTTQIRRGINSYSSPADFRERFETDLEEIIVRLLKKLDSASKPTDTASPAVLTFKSDVWHDSPFPGLRAFTETDAPIFFGRNKETDALVKRVAENRFVAVIGASGSGKSSLVGAGLNPRLRANAISDEHTGSKDWFIARFTPNENPFESLYEALIEAFPAIRPNPLEARRIKQNFIRDVMNDPATLRDTVEAALTAVNAPEWAELLLFIDQFEELFTLAKEEYRAPFTRLLTDIADRIRVVTTMRADFYYRAVEYLAEQLQDGTFPLAAPTPAALYQMITRPAERAALEFEEGLPEKILEDVGTDPGALALMSYTLDELYKIAVKRGDRKLTFADYDALEGVHGAIGKSAEQTFNNQQGTDEEKAHLLARVFRELVEVDERGTATRHRAAAGRFSDDEMVLIRAFTDARLLVMDADCVEVAHEALFRSWERLKAWIVSAQEDLILLRQVRNAAHDWENKERKSYLLWNDERLKLVYEMKKRLQPALNEVEQEFIEPEAYRLLRELEDINTSHKRRYDIGDRLSVIGDPRPGVGVREDGIPDIAWCLVSPGGEIEIKGIIFTVQPFYIAKYLVTYAQFQAFVEAPDGFNDDRWWVEMPQEYVRQEVGNPPSQQGNYPRSTVSWYQAVAFSRWLDYQYRERGLFDQFLALDTGGRDKSRPYVIRLPTEWEWQWMAQNGAETREYPWGESDNKPRANTTEAGINDRSSAVGMYPHGTANCGAFDVAGNLFEWCLNDYKILNNISYTKNEYKVLRGGSFNVYRDYAACAYRDYFRSNHVNHNFGLRVCCALSISTL